jgi:hypothetical protein
MNSYSVNSDEAMKQGDEALNTSLLIRYNFYSAFNASLPLLFKENYRVTLHRRYFFTEIHRLRLHRRHFLK